MTLLSLSDGACAFTPPGWTHTKPGFAKQWGWLKFVECQSAISFWHPLVRVGLIHSRIVTSIQTTILNFVVAFCLNFFVARLGVLLHTVRTPSQASIIATLPFPICSGWGLWLFVTRARNNHPSQTQNTQSRWSNESTRTTNGCSIAADRAGYYLEPLIRSLLIATKRQSCLWLLF